MAGTYHLLCLDCLVYLSLGKVYSADKTGRPLGRTTFDGVHDPIDGCWHRQDAVFGRATECFLIGHRNHELRFVPEGVDELLDTPTRVVEEMELGDLFAQDGPEPDPEEELRGWSERTESLNPGPE